MSDNGKNISMETIEKMKNTTDVVGELLERYVPILYGWGGMIGIGAAWHGYVSTETGLLVGFLASTVCAVFGHHAVEMGWHDAE